MSSFSRMKAYWRLAWGLRGFLKEPITLEQSREIIKQRLANREKNLLTLVKLAIYENKKSPYLKLLKLAGCEYGDFEKMTLSDGIEPTLYKLREEGVYICYEEFKGKKEFVRGGTTFEVKPSDFDNPFPQGHLVATTGGSRSAGTTTVYDFRHLTLNYAVYAMCSLDAYDALDVPIVVWLPTAPGSGPLHVLEYTKLGRPPAKWFTPVSNSNFRPSLINRIGTNYIVYMSRLCGTKVPAPEYVPLGEAWKVAQWIAETIACKGGCYIHTIPSRAVAICHAAKEEGLDIAGTKFFAGAEPLTKIKQQEIEASGASINVRYVFTEGGWVGCGCSHPLATDDIHFLKDSFALIQHRREVPHAMASVDAFLFTSLLLSVPKVLLNVDIGDHGVIEQRSCGCKFEELGLIDHIHSIRGYDKVTSAGMTFLGTDLIRVVEEVLPAKFGGASIDYQMIEEEDEGGYTHMSVIVNPDVENINEAELIQTVLTELSKGPDYQRIMAEVWSQEKILRVKRMKPLITSMGKLLPLHIRKSR